MTIAAPAPPTLPAASGTGSPSADSINATQPLSLKKTYTTLDYKNNLSQYQAAISTLSTDPTQATVLAKAKLYRNSIIWGEMSIIEDVYAVYHSRLFSNKNMTSVANDALTLGLGAAATIAGNKETKTILSALGTAFAGLGLSIDKNYFAQQSFQILGIAMQTRRDNVRAAIATRLNLCDVISYPLEQGQRDLVQYFGAGTLDSAVQELQEEAASAKSTASAVANNVTPPPQAPTVVAPPSMCPITPPPSADKPSFDPTSGVYSKPLNVTIRSTPGATIYYTTDGNPPSTSSQKFDSQKPIPVTQTGTIQAFAIAPGYSISALGSAGYTIGTSPAATPVFGVPSSTYHTPVNIVISAATPGSTIYYTLDGTPPSTSETGTTKKYTQQFTLSESKTVNAIATAEGYTASAVAQAVYTISLPAAATPTFTPQPGTYNSAQSVTISSSTIGTTIFYTTDGSLPTTTVTGNTRQYDTNHPVPVSSTQTIVAIATADGYSVSQAGSATYTLATAAPAFDRPTGPYDAAIMVHISSLTQGAIIYYTIDGSQPATSVGGSTRQYDSNNPISVSSTQTIKAIAIASDLPASQVTSVTYTITQH